MSKGMIGIIVGVLLAILALNSVFIVDQREQALILAFGKPQRVESEPGLKFKWPWYSTNYMDKRILDLDEDPKEFITSDQKRLIVDAYAKYRIREPLIYYQKLKNELRANQRLKTILESSLRRVLGSQTLIGLLAERRSAMEETLAIVNAQASSFGIEVVDVRIMRADLPEKNSEAIYRRMQAEREREAMEFRAQGAEEAQRIMSKADKERKVLIAEANRDAAIFRGQGDAVATELFGKAFSQDAEFFDFYRSMQAYEKTLKKGDTSLVLSPNSEFLRFFDNKEFLR